MLFTSSLVTVLAGAAAVSAAPTRLTKRAAIDIVVFKFADVLEQLETQFYKKALDKFKDPDFAAAGFPSSQVPIEQFQVIQQDEATHATVIEAALKSFGEKPITSCKFNFDAALKDVATMAATARVVENVGVSAYLGAATLMTDVLLLDAAASILTVEARHSTLLNILSQTGTSVPSAFDIPLTPSEIIAIATPFFDGPCDLGVPANPTLAITNTGTVAPGTKLTFSSPALNSTVDQSKVFCQMMIGGATSSIALPLSQCVVPQINGPVAIWLTTGADAVAAGQPLINNVRDRATTQLLAGPTMAFIDTQPQLLGQLARVNVNNAGLTGSSTRTISPSEASSAIAGASTPAAVGVADAAAIPTSAATDSAAAAATSSPSSTVGAAEPASTFVGTSADGAITVQGWSNLP